MGFGFARAAILSEGALMANGTVKFFDDAHGWGFIKADTGGDVFVHATQFVDGVTTLVKGDRVMFTVEEDPKSKRPRAANVRLEDDA